MRFSFTHVSVVLVGLGLASTGWSQEWKSAYQQGVTEATKGNWAAAANLFESAIAAGPEDTSQGIRTEVAPGFVQVWRGGMAYTPHWGAGYAAFKASGAEEGARKWQLERAVGHFEWLFVKGFRHPLLASVAAKAYTLLEDRAKSENVARLIGDSRVDMSFVADEDKPTVAVEPVKKPDPDPTPPKVTPPSDGMPQPVVGQVISVKPPVKVPYPDSSVDPGKTPGGDKPAVSGSQTVAGQFPKVMPKPRTSGGASDDGTYEIIIPDDVGAQPVIEPGTGAGTRPPDLGPDTVPTGLVPKNPTKFALLIGNANYGGVGDMPNAAPDVAALASALKDYAGYVDANVSTLVNATRDEMLTTVSALAQRLPEDAIVFVFFTGQGRYNATNGKDFVLGVGDLGYANAVSKDELLGPLTDRAARLVSVWQTGRPVEGNKAFGAYVPNQPGSFAIWNACAAGQKCYASADDEGRWHGVFVTQLIEAMKAMPSVAFNVSDLSGKLAGRVREAASAVGARGSGQIPPRPILTNLNPDEALF